MSYNPTSKLIYGVAYSDVRPVTFVNEQGEKKSFVWYQKWKSMLKRCYDQKSLQRNPTYNGCSVCDEWLYASKFKQWYETQGEVDNLVLDKDFLSEDTKIYSPETCLFLTQEMNQLMVKVKNSGDRGFLPVGVTYVPTYKFKQYVAHLTIKGKRKTLGYYHTSEEAYQAYLLAKINHIKTFFTSIDELSVADEMKNKIRIGLESAIQYLNTVSTNTY